MSPTPESDGPDTHEGREFSGQAKPGEPTSIDESERLAGGAHAAQVARWRKRTRRRTRKNLPFWAELPILLVVAFILTFFIQTFVAKVYYVPSGSMEQTLHGVSSGGDRILASKVANEFGKPRQGEIIVFKGPDSWAPEADIPGPTSWGGKLVQSLGSVIGIAPPNEKDFVKRVIAVGGQTISCCDKQGATTVDGKPLHEPYIYIPLPFSPGNPDENCTPSADGLYYGSPDLREHSRCFAPFTVPEGQLYVMGDHRSDSLDSAFYCHGLTAKGEAQYKQVSVNGSDCNRPIPVSDAIGKAIFIVMPPSRWGGIGSPDIGASLIVVGGLVGLRYPGSPLSPVATVRRRGKVSGRRRMR